MTQHEGPPLDPEQPRQVVATATELAREGRTEMLADLVDHGLPVDVFDHGLPVDVFDHAEASGRA